MAITNESFKENFLDYLKSLISSTGSGSDITFEIESEGESGSCDPKKESKSKSESDSLYSIFFSTAQPNPLDEHPGTGDIDYAQTLVDAINRVEAGVGRKAHYIKGLFKEEAIYDYIENNKTEAAPILHLMLRAPETGFAFSPAGLQKFKKKTGAKIIITPIEFAKYPEKYLGSKIAKLQYLSIADEIVFLDELDKQDAIKTFSMNESVKQSALVKYEYEMRRSFSIPTHYGQALSLIQKQTDAGKLTKASVIPVPPTIPELSSIRKNRGKDIIVFGMIRMGKGFAHVLKLAKLMKSYTENKFLDIEKRKLFNDKKILIVGTLLEHHARNTELSRLMFALYPSKVNDIENAKSASELKKLLTIYQADPHLKPALPIEIHLDVPVDRLQSLFDRCTYAFIPEWRGASLRTSSISSCLGQFLVTYSHMLNPQFDNCFTPACLREGGEYDKSFVLMKDDSYDRYANLVFADIERRECDPKLNAETEAEAARLVSEVISSKVVARRHFAIYERLGVVVGVSISNSMDSEVTRPFGSRRVSG